MFIVHLNNLNEFRYDKRVFIIVLNLSKKKTDLLIYCIVPKLLHYTLCVIT